jgi:capsular polysaccharide export protein
MHLAIEHILTSFARHAPDAARLVVKLPPLDSGIIDWRAVTGHIGADLGIADRLVVVDGGDLDKIVARRAVITVNSTVGGLALARGLPVIALGRAVYDIPGLTHQGELSDPGSFFSERGVRLAVEAAIDRLEAIDFAPPIAASSANDPQCSNVQVEDLGPRWQGPMLEPARCVRATDRAFFAERIDNDPGKPMCRQVEPSRG